LHSEKYIQVLTLYLLHIFGHLHIVARTISCISQGTQVSGTDTPAEEKATYGFYQLSCSKEFKSSWESGI